MPFVDERGSYSSAELAYAVTRLFEDADRSPILPMLSDDVVLRLPDTLPYGGEFTGRTAFDEFFSKSPAANPVWESFDITVEDVIAADDHIIARLTNTAVPKATGKAVVFENLWLFSVADGRIVRVQLYADTAVTTGGPAS
ncbi:nuclear transport factor 2 family protein [Asanoa sp. WMMD1127]|uniref:nuclear transport factor 2 family protein n=1 Tax=Asanoa sp. WMMD1127 TaxID=3016107 RepID=UPI00241634D7|nr:nuclear transport factor 2 family protein [Asanoa sp. WMMD1127]MDG4820589.1 nuclear transport factor 2 family protein [Asanoa sp. WMMD1127]